MILHGQTNGVYKVLSHLAISEDTVLDCNLHFRVIFREFSQTHEGSHNDMTTRSIDAITLGPNGNPQNRIRCFNISTGKILQR